MRWVEGGWWFGDGVGVGGGVLVVVSVGDVQAAGHGDVVIWVGVAGGGRNIHGRGR